MSVGCTCGEEHRVVGLDARLARAAVHQRHVQPAVIALHNAAPPHTRKGEGEGFAQSAACDEEIDASKAATRFSSMRQPQGDGTSEVALPLSPVLCGLCVYMCVPAGHGGGEEPRAKLFHDHTDLSRQRGRRKKQD